MKMLDPQPWMASANCCDADPELFFPEGAETSYLLRQVREKYCNGCSVQAECYEFGMRTASHGIWGGVLVQQQPKQRLSPRRPPLPPQQAAQQQQPRRAREPDDEPGWLQQLMRRIRKG